MTLKALVLNEFMCRHSTWDGDIIVRLLLHERTLIVGITGFFGFSDWSKPIILEGEHTIKAIIITNQWQVKCGTDQIISQGHYVYCNDDMTTYTT